MSIPINPEGMSPSLLTLTSASVCKMTASSRLASSRVIESESCVIECRADREAEHLRVPKSRKMLKESWRQVQSERSTMITGSRPALGCQDQTERYKETKRSGRQSEHHDESLLRSCMRAVETSITKRLNVFLNESLPLELYLVIRAKDLRKLFRRAFTVGQYV